MAMKETKTCMFDMMALKGKFLHIILLQPEDVVTHHWLSASAVPVATCLLGSLEVGYF